MTNNDKQNCQLPNNAWNYQSWKRKLSFQKHSFHPSLPVGFFVRWTVLYVSGPFKPAKTRCDWKPWEYIWCFWKILVSPKSSIFDRVFHYKHYKPSIFNRGNSCLVIEKGALTHASSLHSRDFARLISVASSVPWTRKIPGWTLQWKGEWTCMISRGV